MSTTMRIEHMLRFLILTVPVFAASTLATSAVSAADKFAQPPISYRDSTPDNRVARLQQKLDTGKLKLTFDPDYGYLTDLLQALEVPTESQMLVFSKTSLQRHRISPQTPRAIYFNDDVYIGYCQAGDVLEISAVDPQLGTVFYTLDQIESGQPQFNRRVDKCVICHGSSRTGGVPGHVVRSLFVESGGQPMFSAASRAVDHTTPLKDRWGGWYVTGRHGSQSHVGNLVLQAGRTSAPVDNSQGHNVIDLKDRFNTGKYLSPHSDIVALMVLEHQTLVHNRLTKANFAARQALHHEAKMNRAIGNEVNKRLPSTSRRIQNAGDELIQAMLLVDEVSLTSAISGTSGYAEHFRESGPRDSQGRSLKDLDLNQRLFTYPCSYLIYSEAFDGLPQQMHDYVWRRLWEILSGQDQSPKFAHLSSTDRQAITDIIRDTKFNLPDFWMDTKPQ